ncbi:MAG: ABC transporter ATP-binding protein [Trebonia sp.]|uniref:ABC transporter ATP-binding protein n=1 Tax=Trebonia sp. TaxID=2767075 RepID=UPI003BB1D184
MSEQQVAEEIRASPQDAGASQDPPAIELHGVIKEFRSHGEVVTAVRDLHIAIAEGEFFSLLGPSGCGKTTTMRIVAGFEEPTAGTVYLHGTDVTNVPPHKRDVNMVFQSYALFPHMTVFDNVAFGLRRQNTPKKEVTDRVTDILGVVGLDGYAKRRPRQLSGGQQQRVALARALVNRPRALLLDEPLGALDLKLRQAMQIELKRIQREVGITFVYVTHDQGEALTMSDRIAVMNEGVIEQLAAPRDIYEHPKTRFVAGFIGTSNLLSGTVTSTDPATDGAVIDLGADGGRIIVPAAGRRPGDELEITVRPEKITLVADVADVAPPAPAGQHDCALRGTVAEVVYLGTSTNYNVTTAAGAEVVVYSQNSANDASGPQRGEQVWLHWDSANSYAIGNTQ